MGAVTQSDRYHALDSLRGFAMFLGILIHAVISFMLKPPSFWPVRDNDPNPLADLFLFAVHDFRMQTFFLLAGFFGCLLFQRYGLRSMLMHRVRRIAIPFVLAVLLIVPPLQAIWLYGEIEAFRAEGVPDHDPSPVRILAAELVAADPTQSTAAIIGKFFQSGRFLTGLAPIHLWFLYYLLWCYTTIAGVVVIANRLAESRLERKTDAAFRTLIQCRFRVLIPACATVPMMYTMKSWYVDTPENWFPKWNLLAYYFGFFVFGWMLYRHRDLVQSFGRGWKWILPVANFLVLPAMIGLTISGLESSTTRKGPIVIPQEWLPTVKFAAFSAASLYTWLMIVGMWGAFLALFSTPRAWVRYLADASYWCYIASLAPTLVLQMLVANWPLPGVMKLLFVVVATMAILLVSYEWCVRYTAIGAVLNGRKYRTPVPSHDAG